MNAFEELLAENKKIVPVVSVPALELAVPLVDSLVSSGFNLIEITLRTDCALDAISRLSIERPDVIIGAGTVKTCAQLEHAVQAGARFIVSPGLDIGMVNEANHQNIPIIPGIMTATELMQAENIGLRVAKLFPAMLAGGVDFLNAMQPVFPEMKFFPTGGIREDNLNEFLACDNVLCVGGTWLTPTKLVIQQDWAKLREIASRY